MSAIPTPAASAGNRFARYTPDNHSAPLWIASVLSFIFAFLVLGVRLGYVKLKLYGIDDVVLSLAHVIGVAQWTSMFVGLDNGLGKTMKLISPLQLTSQAEAVYASRILLMVALCLTKVAVLLCIRSLFTGMRPLTLISNVAIGIAAAWGIAASLTISVGCSPDSVINSGGQCSGQTIRLQIVTILDVISEVGIFLLVPLFLKRIQMRLPRKLLVVLAFSFRLPTAILSIFYYTTYAHFIRSNRPGTHVVTPYILQNCLLSYSLMSSTMPTLNGFMKNFTTGGMGYTNTTELHGSGSRPTANRRSNQGSGSNGLSSHSGGNSYQMYSVKAKAASVLGGKSSVVSTVSGPGMQGGGMNGGKIGFPSGVMRRGGDKNMTKENASMESQESQSVMIRD